MKNKLSELERKCQEILADPDKIGRNDKRIWEVNRLFLEIGATSPHDVSQALDFVSPIIPYIPSSDTTSIWKAAQQYNHEVAYKMIEQVAQMDEGHSETRWEALIGYIQPHAPKGLMAKVAKTALSVGMDRQDILEGAIKLVSDKYVLAGHHELLEQFDEMAKIVSIQHDEKSASPIKIFVEDLLFLDQYANKDDYHQVRERANLALNTLIRHGANIEQCGRAYTEEGLSMISPFHVACWEMEHRDPQPIGITLDVLLDCGADWAKVKEHRHGPKGVAWARMQRHPAVRKAMLGEIADKHQHDQVSKKPKI